MRRLSSWHAPMSSPPSGVKLVTHVAKMAKRCMRSARPCTVPRAESRQTRMRLSSLDTARLRGGGRGVSAGQLPWACGGWARAEQTAIHAARPSPPLVLSGHAASLTPY